MSPDERFRHALKDLVAALEEVRSPSMIIGGLAVIISGVPRNTIDIDAAILGRSTDVDRVFDVLQQHGIVARIDDARRFAQERQVLLLRHQPSGITMEISFAWLPFEEEALSRAMDVEFEGLKLRVARPEDLIVYKAAAWRDRDRSDIERLLTLHLASIDLVRVRTLVDQIARALDDPSRLSVFDEMVIRARG